MSVHIRIGGRKDCEMDVFTDKIGPDYAISKCTRCNLVHIFVEDGSSIEIPHVLLDPAARS